MYACFFFHSLAAIKVATLSTATSYIDQVYCLEARHKRMCSRPPDDLDNVKNMSPVLALCALP